jgi:hypothetical protein
VWPVRGAGSVRVTLVATNSSAADATTPADPAVVIIRDEATTSPHAFRLQCLDYFRWADALAGNALVF